MNKRERFAQFRSDVWFEFRWLFCRDNSNSPINHFKRWWKRHICDQYPYDGLLILCMVVGIAAPDVVIATESWKITAYCACSKCCGKSDGITASGRKAQYGMVACNWLKFGTKVTIDGLGVFTVADRGAQSLFGSSKNHIKHIDVYMPTHKQARNFGVKYLTVEVN